MNFETVFFNNGLEHYSSEDTGIARMFKTGLTFSSAKVKVKLKLEMNVTFLYCSQIQPRLSQMTQDFQST